MPKKRRLHHTDSELQRINDLEVRLSGSQGERINRAIIQQSPVGISVRDRNGNLILCNPAWAGIWENTTDDIQEALSRKHDTLQMDNKDQYLGDSQKLVKNVYEHGGDLILEEIYIPTLKKWIQQRFYGITGENNVTEFVVVLTEDVTEKKKAEKIESELRRSTEKYRKLVENLPVAAYTTNSSGNCIFANSAMVEMFEESSREGIYRIPVTERYLRPDARIRFIDEIHASGKVNGYEVELVTRTGKPFWASISATATLDGQGNVHTIDGIIRDISSNRALEEEILKNQKLESIGILAGGIAHDFNNIMAAVLGNLSLARLYAKGDMKILEKLENAERASIRASELTRQLLTFSKGGKPIRKPCSIQKTLRESALFAATGSATEVRFDISPDLWSVDADESQIAQVVSNIVLNSIQASSGGGVVIVSAKNAVLGTGNTYSLAPGKYIELKLTDNGPGIPLEIRSRIFDPYFTTRPTGTGLGLATVYSIIKNHSGSVTVGSAHPGGTEFTILLPWAGGEIRDDSDSHPSVARGSGRVLVMDDEESVRNVVSELLDHHGYTTCTADDGEQAVEMYRVSYDEGSPYDVVITDITVPGGMGGVEAAHRILRMDPAARIIVASGYSNSTAMAHFKEHGFIDSVAKPFSIDILLDAVSRAMKR